MEAWHVLWKGQSQSLSLSKELESDTTKNWEVLKGQNKLEPRIKIQMLAGAELNEGPLA